MNKKPMISHVDRNQESGDITQGGLVHFCSFFLNTARRAVSLLLVVLALLIYASFLSRRSATASDSLPFLFPRKSRKFLRFQLYPSDSSPTCDCHLFFFSLFYSALFSSILANQAIEFLIASFNEL